MKSDIMKKILMVTLSLFTMSCSQKNAVKERNCNVATCSDTVKFADMHVLEPVQSDSIKKYSQLLKELYIGVESAEPVEDWFLPFALLNRSDMNNITLISGYGAYRSTRVKGHKHSGIDIVPADKKTPLDVYAIAKGVVCFICQKAPVKTVIIKHKLKDGSVVFSSYIHLKELFIAKGQTIDESTKIGVLYTGNDALKYGGNFDHLHFEIKKRIDDYSCASWLCMTREELDEYFINPSEFFKDHLKTTLQHHQ